MILSGHAIRDAVDRGDIRIEPFDARYLGPNSYDYRLQPELVIIEPGEDGEPRRVTIEDAGFTLEPGRLYLGATEELIGSVTAASAHQPLSLHAVSILMRSPSRISREPGMPWTICSLMEMQVHAGNGTFGLGPG